MEEKKWKIVEGIAILIIAVIVIVAIVSTYIWIVSGEQYIKINTPNKVFTNSDLHVSVVAQENKVDLDTKTKLKLLNSEGKTVKNVNIKYDGNNAVLSIPDIEAGNYFLEAKVSSKAGKDTIKKDIYISDGNVENVTITLDKGIYKPGDTVNYRALLTSKQNDEPISKDVNVSIYDGNDNRVYNEDIKSSEYGIISGNFVLANEVNSGLYKLIVKTETSEVTKQFKVNPYVTPKYEVKINYDKENYIVGEKAQITFDAKYFFGESVQNADMTVYVNDEQYTTLKTNEQGISTMEYDIKEAKTYNIKVETVDSSNYYTETTSSFIAGNDIFEIDLLPEYGTLAAGKANEVYVFTKRADGTPLKTYVTISSNNFTKQVATDENGVGRFSIDIDQIDSSNSTKNSSTYDTLTNKSSSTDNNKQFSVVAEDINGNKVSKDISLKIEKKNLLVATDKVKYQQGEDIKINVSSINENSRDIYFFKNDKLIKMLNTDLEDTTINLGDEYGLIDIYVTEKTQQERNYYYESPYTNNTFKKTIFIKPEKKLNITIGTDKEVYKPGEKINISFNTTDENNTNDDAALLVSMLDNSVLNLANNDLSIDNIKLALQDIKFSNELDALTLYSCIIDDSSEQTMMALLLKQSDKDINVSEIGMYNHEQEETASIVACISIGIIIFIVFAFLFVWVDEFKNILSHIINFIMFDFILNILAFGLMEKYYWHAGYSWLMFGIVSILGLTVYILFVHKISKKVIKTTLLIIITYLLFILLGYLGYQFDVSPFIPALIISVVLLILVIIAKIAEIKKLKIDKYMKRIYKEVIFILKFICAVIISVIASGFIQQIIYLDEAMISILLILIYGLNYLFNRPRRKINEEEKEKFYEGIERGGQYVLGALAVIGAFAIISFGIIIYNDTRSITNGSAMDELKEPQYSINSGFASGVDSSKSENSSQGPSIFDNIGDMFNHTVSGIAANEQETTNGGESSIVQEGTEAEKVKDNNVRNVFLESMCFIPELITTNGTANLDLDLSDNITTWTIQTVGNTKDGRIGYGMIDNVKVFKDFFVDFELPKNLVETDNVSIPVTVYNYTDNPITANLKIEQADWFNLDNNNLNVNVNAKSSNMVYVPITILKAGDNKFRVETTANSLTDIVEKECSVSNNGYKVEKVISTGTLDKNISEDILFLDDMVENTAKAKVKIYSSTISQAIEGMENIFQMPTGCFEQISSTLYPNILALKYMEDSGIVDEEIKEKALSYISSGYQKLLTYEVNGESGGYSLYGHSPAETVLTAYGLMEVTDLSQVYDVDNSVIEKMTNYLYKMQNSNGTFKITGNHIGGAGSRETLSLNAYITWALSESNPKDERLNKSINYLKDKIDDIDDNYTLALVANALANVKDNQLNDVLKRLVSNVELDGDKAYITSDIMDYYGSRGDVQTVQTIALTSMALSKSSGNQETNKMLINYLISKKNSRGNWYSTQATILSLKALNERNEKSKLENQTISVKVNSDEKTIEIKDNPLELYELTFDNLSKENKLNIELEKGNAYYEVIEEYYKPYDKVDTTDNKIEVSVQGNNNLKVNEILQSNIKVINRSGENISNAMVTISIPQGFTVAEESLMQLESKGIIEKYEMTYSTVNIYLRNFETDQIVDLTVGFRASYPVKITGLFTRAYDYYNPDVEGFAMPTQINVTQ